VADRRNMFDDEPAEPNVPRVTVRPQSFTPAQRNITPPRANMFDSEPVPQPRTGFDAFSPKQFNRPFGELKPYQRSPTEQVQSWGQDLLMGAGANPHVAGRLSRAYTDIGRTLTPMGAILSGADMPYHVNRGDYGAAAFDALGAAPAATIARRMRSGTPEVIPAHVPPPWLRDEPKLPGMPRRSLPPQSVSGPPDPASLGFVTPSNLELSGRRGSTTGAQGTPTQGTAQTGYDAINASPVRYHPNSGHDISALAQQHLSRQPGGFTRQKAPEVYDTLEQFAQRTAAEGRLLTPGDLDTLRQSLRGLEGPNGPAGNHVVNMLDTWMTSRNPAINSRIVQGTPDDLNAMRANFQQARGDYRAGETSRTVEDAIDRADTRAGSTYSGMGAGNATRQNLAAFSNSQAGRDRIFGATQAEREAIWRASQGSPMANVERTVSNVLGGGGGAATTVASGTVGGAAGTGAHMLGFDPVSSLIIGGGAGLGAAGLGRAARRSGNERIVNAAEDAATGIRQNSPEYARRAALPENAPIADPRIVARDRLTMMLMPTIKDTGTDAWNQSFIPFENRE